METLLTSFILNDKNNPENNTTSLPLLIAYLDFQFQYNIGNVEIFNNDEKITLNIYKFQEENIINDEFKLSSLEMQTMPSKLPALNFITLLQSFYDRTYSDVEFKMSPKANGIIFLTFLKVSI